MLFRENQILEDCLPAVDYSGEVFSTEEKIRSLAQLIGKTELRSDTLLDPVFFLASLTEVWLPRVVVVRRGGEVTCIIYAKERTIAGRRLGVVYADLTFGSILLGNPRDHCDTFLFALRTLLDFSGIRGVRLRLRRSTPEVAAVRKLLSASRLDAQFSRTKDHAVLSLPGTYQQLLGRFRSGTRKNFRYYRHRCEAEGHVFIESLSLEDLRSAAAYSDQESLVSAGRKMSKGA